ncbi:MAG TPA: universal stress protein [Puia sp.]|nr:universal stress protein [Puia sp.]
MENILLALDGTHLDMNTIEFACYAATITHSKLTAIFVENLKGEERPRLKQLYALPYVETITAEDFPENEKKKASSQENERIFGEACTNRGVNYRIHRNRQSTVRDMIDESRFADMIIVNPATSFLDETESAPSQFVRDLLAGAECPVIISPYSFDGIDEILFAYDGSKSATFAFKQFVHLFPSLQSKKLTVLQVDKKSIQPFKEGEKISELLRAHFSSVRFEHLQGKPANELFGYLLGKQNLFVVMGAYGRGILSNLFAQSTADLVVKTINLPLFIAHA